MSGTGVNTYAAIQAKVRVMYSTLLTQEDFQRLSQSSDFDALLDQLKRTPYGPYLDRVKDRDLTPRRAAFQIKTRLAEDYHSLIRAMPMSIQSLVIQFYRSFEVDNLKAVLRGIVTEADWDTVRFVLFPYGPNTVIPAQEILESKSINNAVELVRGTPYYTTLSFALKRYSTEQSLFPLEVALDLNYWRELWKEINSLSGQDRAQAKRIIGSLVDITNLMWAIRYRVYHHLSEEELINYTLSFGYHVKDEDIRSLAAGADIVKVVNRLYPGIRDLDQILDNPQRGLPKLEVELQRYEMQQCNSAFIGYPFHIGIPLAFLVLSKLEIQDLIVLIEAKSAEMPEEDFRQYLLMEDTSE